MCEANFALHACGICARTKKKCLMQDACFPLPDAQQPSWLPWERNEWISYRAAWYSQINELLSIETYMERRFHMTERLQTAQFEVSASERENGSSSVFATQSAAQAWLRRVRRSQPDISIHGTSPLYNNHKEQLSKRNCKPNC